MVLLLQHAQPSKHELLSQDTHFRSGGTPALILHAPFFQNKDETAEAASYMIVTHVVCDYQIRWVDNPSIFFFFFF